MTIKAKNHLTSLLLAAFMVITTFTETAAQKDLEGYEIGYYFDINKQPIEGYTDFYYAPEKSLKVTYVVGNEYSPGYYYDLYGNKVKGLLKFSSFDTFFKYKKDEEDKSKTFKPEDCTAYVIGTDSFTVIEDFTVERDVLSIRSKKQEFAEVIDRVAGYTFYKHTRAGLHNVIHTFLVRKDGLDSLMSFPKQSSKFREMAIEIFGDFHALKQRILEKEFRSKGFEEFFLNKPSLQEEDIPKMIKLYKFYHKYLEKKPIYFDKAWGETDLEESATFYANIETITDTSFHLKFYTKLHTPIYDGHFTSFFPHQKTADFNFYYPNGTIRKKLEYDDDDLMMETAYHPNGIIRYVFDLRNETAFFSEVKDETGKELLDEDGSGVETFNDPISGKQFILEYNRGIIDRAHYINQKGEKVYQLYDKKIKFKKFAYFQTKIKEDFEYTHNAILNNKQGLALIKCSIDQNGNTTSFELIKSVHPSLDRQILKIMNREIFDAHWKKVKIDKERVRTEIIIPVEFVIQGYTRHRNNNMWYNNHMMHQQMMMHNQMMRQNQMMMQNQMMRNNMYRGF